MQAFRSRLPSLWLLLAAALMLRVLVPTGWMLDTGQRDTITLRICNAGTVMTIPIDREGAPGKSGRAEAPCTFAGFAGAALLPDGEIVLAALPPPSGQVRMARLARLLLLRTKHEFPPGQGPPVRA